MPFQNRVLRSSREYRYPTIQLGANDTTYHSTSDTVCWSSSSPIADALYQSAVRRIISHIVYPNRIDHGSTSTHGTNRNRVISSMPRWDSRRDDHSFGTQRMHSMWP